MSPQIEELAKVLARQTVNDPLRPNPDAGFQEMPSGDLWALGRLLNKNPISRFALGGVAEWAEKTGGGDEVGNLDRVFAALDMPAAKVAGTAAAGIGALASLLRQGAKREAKGLAKNLPKQMGALAYHGSPHRWAPDPGFPEGRPRLDKVGTGEGSQAYGWGWYSAENPSVAKTYAESVKVNAPQVYKLDIPDEYMDRLLDFDKPLTEQPKKVKEALEATPWYKYAEEWADDVTSVRGENPTPRHLLHWLYEDYTPEEAADLLRKAGIPGNRYLDQGSRTAGEGTYNYVIWDQDLLDKVKVLETQ